MTTTKTSSKYEFTRLQKETDRINHIRITGAQTGNVFLAYRNNAELDSLRQLEKATILLINSGPTIKWNIPFGWWMMKQPSR